MISSGECFVCDSYNLSRVEMLGCTVWKTDGSIYRMDSCVSSSTPYWLILKMDRFVSSRPVILYVSRVHENLGLIPLCNA